MGNGELSKVWPIIASLTRTVELLDLCREAEDKSQMQGFLRPDPLPSPGSWVEEEERRRVFWNIFILDRYVSLFSCLIYLVLTTTEYALSQLGKSRETPVSTSRTSQ